MENNKSYRVYTDFAKEIQVSVSNSESKEPALKVGAVVSGVFAGVLGIMSLVAPNWTDNKTASFIAMAVTVLLPVFTAIITRGFVWSPATVMELAREVIKSVEEHDKKPPAPKNLPF